MLLRYTKGRAFDSDRYGSRGDKSTRHVLTRFYGIVHNLPSSPLWFDDFKFEHEHTGT